MSLYPVYCRKIIAVPNRIVLYTFSHLLTQHVQCTLYCSTAETDSTKETKEEWGDPCWLLKMGQMGAQGVHVKGVPWLVLWGRLADTRGPALAALVGTGQNIFFLIEYYFICPHSPSIWAVACLLICVSGQHTSSQTISIILFCLWPASLEYFYTSDPYPPPP